VKTQATMFLHQPSDWMGS